MPPFLMPLLGLAIQYAPSVIGMLAGDKASKMADKVVSISREVLGTDDPKQAQAKLESDPSAAANFATRLNAETDRLRIELADVASARAMQIGLTQESSVIAYTPVVISILIILGWVGLTMALFFVQIEIPERLYNLLNGAYGAINIAFGQVIQFWLGSSRSSQRKDATINLLAPAAANANSASERAAA